MSSSLASIALALAIALLFGPLLGRLATQWFSGLGLVSALTGLRGVFLPFLLAPFLIQTVELSPDHAIGMVVGVVQAISLSRWTTRRSGEWSQALVGGLALGRSRAALVSAMTRSRGAVLATLATTTLQVILLEALLSALALPGCVATGSWGAALWSGANVSNLLVLAVGSLLLLGSELLCGFVLRGRPWVFWNRARKHR